jgi:hypothetical protein
VTSPLPAWQLEALAEQVRGLLDHE